MSTRELFTRAEEDMFTEDFIKTIFPGIGERRLQRLYDKGELYLTFIDLKMFRQAEQIEDDLRIEFGLVDKEEEYNFTKVIEKIRRTLEGM